MKPDHGRTPGMATTPAGHSSECGQAGRDPTGQAARSQGENAGVFRSEASERISGIRMYNRVVRRESGNPGMIGLHGKQD
jgi:hypothetical protein